MTFRLTDLAVDPNPQNKAILLQEPYHSLITHYLSVKDDFAIALTSRKAMFLFIKKWSDPKHLLSVLGKMNAKSYARFLLELPPVIKHEYRNMLMRTKETKHQYSLLYVCYALICDDSNEIYPDRLLAEAAEAEDICNQIPNFPKRLFDIIRENVTLLYVMQPAKSKKIRDIISGRIFEHGKEIGDAYFSILKNDYYVIGNIRNLDIQIRKENIEALDDFSGMFLSGIDLTCEMSNTNSDLKNKCFINADLSKAKLMGFTLNNANFTGANLQGANLNGANLQGACFIDADLRDVSIGHLTANHVYPGIKGFTIFACLATGDFKDAIEFIKENRFIDTTYFSSVTSPADLLDKLSMFNSVKTDQSKHFIYSVVSDLVKVILREIEDDVIEASSAFELLTIAKNHPFISGKVSANAALVLIEETIRKITPPGIDFSKDIELRVMKPKK